MGRAGPLCCALLRAWIEDRLRAPEQGNRFPVCLIRHIGIPDLGRAAAINHGDALLRTATRNISYGYFSLSLSLRRSLINAFNIPVPFKEPCNFLRR